MLPVFVPENLILCWAFVFKSDEYLQILLHEDNSNMHNAHHQSTCGFVCGEVKLSLTLRILSGVTCMDLELIFNMIFNNPYKIFHKVVEEWICNDSLVNINGLDYVTDEDEMEDVKIQFLSGSDGKINGCIGALDGCLVKIQKPTVKIDGVDNPIYFT